MTLNDQAKRNLAEFEGIFLTPGGSRPLMSRPPRMRASTQFVREVRDAFELVDDRHAGDVADWIADKLERFAALHARPVFEMNGNGPTCSYCSMPWPLCGHHHLSGETTEDDE